MAALLAAITTRTHKKPATISATHTHDVASERPGKPRYPPHTYRTRVSVERSVYAAAAYPCV